jgi:hypothetical protein
MKDELLEIDLRGIIPDPYFQYTGLYYTFRDGGDSYVLSFLLLDLMQAI